MTDPTRIDPRAARRSHRRDQVGARRGTRAAVPTPSSPRAPRRGRRPPDRPLRRPGPPVGRVVDRHRPQHGGHQAGRAEAVRAEGARGSTRPRPVRASAASPPAPATSSWHRRTRPGGGQRPDPPGPPDSRPAARTGGARDAGARRAGASTPTVREAPPRPCPRASDECPASSPSTRAAKKVLELTFREALRLGHNYIGTEHLLLALLELAEQTRVAVESRIMRILRAVSDGRKTARARGGSAPAAGVGSGITGGLARRHAARKSWCGSGAGGFRRR